MLLRQLHRWADAFTAVADAPGGIVAMHRVMRYLELVLNERRFEIVRGMIAGLGSATEEAVATYSDRVFAQGKAEGRTEGKREALLDLLAAKFGPLDDSVIDRIAAAPPEALARWLERVLVATRVDAIFES